MPFGQTGKNLYGPPLCAIFSKRNLVYLLKNLKGPPFVAIFFRVSQPKILGLETPMVGIDSSTKGASAHVWYAI